MEGEGSLESAMTEISTNTDSLSSSIIFHVIKDVLGFVLYMHQQIPSVLQDLSLEFDVLQTEYKELETRLAELKAAFRRKHMSRMREVKHGIRRLDKLMNSISSVECALQMTITEIPRIGGVVLALGPTSLRPLYVYELYFPLRNCSEIDFSKTKAADGLSRKAIRTLVSKGAGSGSYPGPTKLFLLVRAPSSFNLPLHFLPKREFKYSKKIEPSRLRLKCRSHDLEMNADDCDSQASSSINLGHPTDDFIWFQCRHVIKGLAFQTPTEE